MRRKSYKSKPARYTRYKIARTTIQRRYRRRLRSLLEQTVASPLSNGNARRCVTCFTCVDDQAVTAGTTVVRCAERCTTRMGELTMTVLTKSRLRSSIATGVLMLSIVVSPPIAAAASPAMDPTVMITDCTGRSKFRPRGGVKTGHRGGHWLRTCATKIPYKTGL